jgi:hypothetical protein
MAFPLEISQENISGIIEGEKPHRRCSIRAGKGDMRIKFVVRTRCDIRHNALVETVVALYQKRVHADRPNPRGDTPTGKPLELFVHKAQQNRPVRWRIS